jgi:citrate synthase
VVTIDGDDYITVDEASAVLAVKRSTLYAYVSRGRLRSYKQGMRRQRLYKRSEVEQLARLSPSRPANVPAVEPWEDVH